MEPAEHVDLVGRLAEAPVWLRAALSGAEASGGVGAADDWSVADIVLHVRAADAILSTRIFQILVREAAPLAAFDERAWGELLAHAGISLDYQVAEFALRRAEIVAVIHSLTRDQWQLAGQHELTGVVSVLDVCRNIAEHEAEHRAQLEGIVHASAARRRT